MTEIKYDFPKIASSKQTPEQRLCSILRRLDKLEASVKQIKTERDSVQ